MAWSCTECGSFLGGPLPPNLASSFVVLTDDLLPHSPRGVPSASTFSRGAASGLPAALAQQKVLTRLCAMPSAPVVPTCASCFEKLSSAIEAEIQHLENRSVAYEAAFRQLQVQSNQSRSASSSVEAPADSLAAGDAASPQPANFYDSDALQQENQQKEAELEQQWLELEQQASEARRELSQLDLESGHLAQLELAMAVAEQEHAYAELNFEAHSAIDLDSLRARLAACDRAAACSRSMEVEPMAALFQVHLGPARANAESAEGSNSSSSSNTNPTNSTVQRISSEVHVNGYPLALIRKPPQGRRDSSADRSSTPSSAAEAASKVDDASSNEANAVACWHEVCTLVACARSTAGLPLWPLPFGPHAPCKSKATDSSSPSTLSLSSSSSSSKTSSASPSSSTKNAAPVSDAFSDEHTHGGTNGSGEDENAANEAADAAVLAVLIAVAATHKKLRDMQCKATATAESTSGKADAATRHSRETKREATTKAELPIAETLPFEKVLREAAHAPVPLPAEQWPILRWAFGEALVEMIALVDGAIAIPPEPPSSI